MKEVHDITIVRNLLNPCHLDEVNLKQAIVPPTAVLDHVQFKELTFEGSVSTAMLQSITDFNAHLKKFNHPLVNVITKLDVSFVNSIMSSIRSLIEDKYIRRWSKAYHSTINKFEKNIDDEIKISLESFCKKMVHDTCFLAPFFIIGPAENLVKLADTNMFICPRCSYIGIKSWSNFLSHIYQEKFCPFHSVIKHFIKDVFKISEKSFLDQKKILDVIKKDKEKSIDQVTDLVNSNRSVSSKKVEEKSIDQVTDLVNSKGSVSTKLSFRSNNRKDSCLKKFDAKDSTFRISGWNKNARFETSKNFDVKDITLKDNIWSDSAKDSSIEKGSWGKLDSKS